MQKKYYRKTMCASQRASLTAPPPKFIGRQPSSSSCRWRLSLQPWRVPRRRPEVPLSPWRQQKQLMNIKNRGIFEKSRVKVWLFRNKYVPLHPQVRDLAQLVAHTSGGREVAGSSPVIPTREGRL